MWWVFFYFILFYWDTEALVIVLQQSQKSRSLHFVVKRLVCLQVGNHWQQRELKVLKHPSHIRLCAPEKTNEMHWWLRSLTSVQRIKSREERGQLRRHGFSCQTLRFLQGLNDELGEARGSCLGQDVVRYEWKQSMSWVCNFRMKSDGPCKQILSPMANYKL